MTQPTDPAQKQPQGSDQEMLFSLLKDTYQYFERQMNPANGLVADKTTPDSPCSIAVVGLALSVYIVAVERKLLARAEAIRRTLLVLRFFAHSHQGPEANATGYKGFYYHFLNMKTGQRAWDCELSTIDTSFLIAGALTAASFFSGDQPGEKEIRDLAKMLNERVEWQWALNGGTTLGHGWNPESGFLNFRWDSGYSEATLMYVLALGSPTHAIDPKCYRAWSATFELRSVYGIDYIYAGPLFIHQLSQAWIDCRGIRDDANRKFGWDYFENSRRATLVHREYAIENPMGFASYGEHFWGITASDGPGPERRIINGRETEFFAYVARGAPDGPDDGTVSPWAVATSLPFAPDIVKTSIRFFIEDLGLKHCTYFGLESSFNPTYPETSTNAHGWTSPAIFGLNEGPVIMMIENYESELIWKLVKNIKPIVDGLKLAGFTGGWLSN